MLLHVTPNVLFQAAFHYQNGGPKQGVNPMTGPNVKNAVRHLDYMMTASKIRCEWMTVHRALLLKSLIQQVLES